MQNRLFVLQRMKTERLPKKSYVTTNATHPNFSKRRLYDEHDNSHDTVDDEIKQLLRIYVRHCL